MINVFWWELKSDIKHSINIFKLFEISFKTASFLSNTLVKFKALKQSKQTSNLDFYLNIIMGRTSCDLYGNLTLFEHEIWWWFKLAFCHLCQLEGFLFYIILKCLAIYQQLWSFLLLCKILCHYKSQTPSKSMP